MFHVGLLIRVEQRKRKYLARRKLLAGRKLSVFVGTHVGCGQFAVLKPNFLYQLGKKELDRALKCLLSRNGLRYVRANLLLEQSDRLFC
jgi:hypothetical protein